ncbi:MAG: hypothetical protein M1831_006326 [Alyxoria varia]|nr:MAG: hypothetical protein M1831_006326 [Alyxoria varia]
MPPWTLVTPASRGIGLELARRLLRTTDLPVVATARKDLDQAREGILRKRQDDEERSDDGAVQQLTSTAREASSEEEGRLKVLRVDVCDEDTMGTAASECSKLFPSSDQQQAHLHASFILPGILYPEKSPSHLDAANLQHAFQINTIGPLLMLKHFSPFLPKKVTPTPLLQSTGGGDPAGLPTDHATWATMSARVGSITDNNALGGWYSYRSSKAAVNQITKSFDNYLSANSGDKTIALSLHPGTVKTGLSEGFWRTTPKGKLFTPGFAAERLLGVVNGVGWEGDTVGGGGEQKMQKSVAEMRGRCWDWRGTEVPP